MLEEDKEQWTRTYLRLDGLPRLCLDESGKEKERRARTYPRRDSLRILCEFCVKQNLMEQIVRNLCEPEFDGANCANSV